MLIPDSCYSITATAAPGHDAGCAERVRTLCEANDALLVWNTSWNANADALATLAQATGLDHWQPRDAPATTRYPLPIHDRLEAIREWLWSNATRDTQWVALDDEPIKHPNALLIARSIGVSDADIARARDMLNKKGVALKLATCGNPTP